jgi:hypothetical protein
VETELEATLWVCSAIEDGVVSSRCRDPAVTRYTYVDTNPPFLIVDLARQLPPGTFEHAKGRCPRRPN